MGSPLVLGLLVTWATPLWLLCAGVALAVAILAVAWCLLWLVSRPAAAEAVATVSSGVLLPIFYLAAFMTGFALLAVVLVPRLPLGPLYDSIRRIAAVGPRDYEFVVPESTKAFEMPFAVPVPELRAFTIESEQPLSIATNIVSGLGQMLTIKAPGGQAYGWEQPVFAEKDRDRITQTQDATKFVATNVSDQPSKVRIHAVTAVEYPQVAVVLWTAASLVGLVLAYLAVQWLMPKVAAIAMTTAKESISQPLFYVALAVGVFSLLFFIFVPYNTFGEDVKMLKDSGLTLIMILAIIVAVWSASVSVSEEVEGRTALTVLSKPVKRRDFVLGKFLGVLGPVVVLFIVLGTLLLVTVSYKVVYDCRETARPEPAWTVCYQEMIRTVPGLVLAFFEAVVLSAISVAISTRLPMLANLLVCTSIYVLGHLVPMLVNSAVGKFEIVRFVGQFLATVLPVLDHFNIQAAVAAGAEVPLSYLGWALVYCIVYSTIAMLLGLAMFEDRDLA